MGVKGLNQLIKEHSPSAYKEFQLKNLFGRKVAIDASMCLYQFLIAVRQSDGQQLTNEDGETTSHLSGMFYRTIKMVENNIKPRRGTKAKTALGDEGTVEEVLKFEKRLVRVTREQNEEAKKLLQLMGIPCVDAPCEAEAQCAELARGGKVYAAASEDMDTLCYEPPFLLRHLTFSEARKMPIDQIEYKDAIAGLDMTKEQFIDLCILLGCDYCESIKGIGQATAFKLIKEHGSLDNIRDNLKWKEPDVDGLIEFMVKQKGFSEDRIRSGAEKLKKGLKGGVQGRLDGFFKVVKTDDKKRKADPKESKASKKKKK
ncbi:XPG I-region family protein [Candida albicans]|uniref:Flap endonuclease 1 n=1 Tax=Candida albicans TaxID=5476 RepID=A0A8H6BZ91_CANAX|nr:XPG I-region family protein [Candida albicans]